MKKQKIRMLLKEMQYSLKIGISKQERKKAQPLFIDLDILFETTRYKKQKIEQTIDYSEIQKSIDIFLKKKEYRLVERVTDDIAAFLLKQFPKIKRIQITCWKPRALAKKKVKNVGIQITKTQ